MCSLVLAFIYESALLLKYITSLKATNFTENTVHVYDFRTLEKSYIFYLANELCHFRVALPVSLTLMHSKWPEASSGLTFQKRNVTWDFNKTLLRSLWSLQLKVWKNGTFSFRAKFSARKKDNIYWIGPACHQPNVYEYRKKGYRANPIKFTVVTFPSFVYFNYRKNIFLSEIVSPTGLYIF